MAHTLDYAKNPPDYKSYESRAKKNFPNETMISKEEFEAITNRNCNYCGKNGPNGIDRVDNTAGYTKDNCVSCCKHCNYVKGDLSMPDFNTWKERFIRKQNENLNLEL